jgi:hypothetical protein
MSLNSNFVKVCISINTPLIFLFIFDFVY